MVLQQQLKRIIIMVILPVAMLLTGCQEEFTEVIEPEANSSFIASDTISDLILKVTLKDGSFDNIIDQCSETSIEFPYSVKLKSELIQISSMEDLEELVQEQTQAGNSFRINYPVTVSYSDYSTEILSSRGELQRIQNRYKHRLKDDDIESIDFVYPIGLSLYDIQFQVPESRLVKSDKEMYGILKGKEGAIIEIGYPVALERFDGAIVEVDNNAALTDAIRNSLGTYDENDEVEIDE